MEDLLRQTLLFDFYGELLTEHQQSVYSDVICNDISCSEIASMQGVSRQSVHDLVRRTQKQLEAYEEKLHLVDKFLRIRADAGRIREEAAASKAENRSADLQLILQAADGILNEL